MKIARLLEQTFIDYPGKIAGMVFVPGCNFSCPACHARQIIESKKGISKEQIFSFLESRKSWLEGLVICGGEPTLQVGLAEFCFEVKKRYGKNFGIKLDTNGSEPGVLENLLKESLVDYVAMDVKGPRSLYPNLIGKGSFDFREFEKSLCITTRFHDYEFRTTIVPVLREDNSTSYVFPEYMTPDEVADIAKMIVDYTGNNNHKYFLQKFVSRTRESGDMVDERLSKESLEKLGVATRTSDELMRACYEAGKIILPNVKIRDE